MNVFKIIGFASLAIVGLFLWSLGIISVDQPWSIICILIVILWSLHQSSEKIKHLSINLEELKSFTEWEINSLKKSNSGDGRSLFELSEEIRTLKEDRDVLSEEVIKIGEEIDGLWENRDTLKEEIDGLLKNVDTLKGDIDSLDKQSLRVIRSIDDRIDNLEWDVRDLKTKTKKCGEIIDRVSERVYSLERKNLKARPVIR